MRTQNLQLLSVQTGSMRPSIDPGDLVAVNSVSAEELALGDVITFTSTEFDAPSITHRVIDIDYENQILTTQGDANDQADEEILFEEVLGRVEVTVPFGGYVVDFIRQSAGLLTLIYVPALIVLASELRRLAQYFKSIQPYRHPSLDRETKQEPLTWGQKFQKMATLSIVMVLISSAVSMPAWAALFDTAALNGNSFSTKQKSRRANHIVIRQLAFRCTRINPEGENVRPSIVLYNPTRETFELEGWTLESSDGEIVEFDEEEEMRRRRSLRIRPHLTDGLNYAGDFLVLKDASGNVVDGISWGSDTTYLDPALPVPNEGHRFQRWPRYVDTDSVDDFKVRDYLNCSHSCFRYDPWEADHESVTNVSITVNVNQISESAAR